MPGHEDPAAAGRSISPPSQLVGFPTSPGVGFGPVVRPDAGSRKDEREAGVVVTSDMSPADVSSFEPGMVTAVVTAAGAPLSHASILARSLGIPAVTGVGPKVLEIPAGTLVLVDGDSGTIELSPAPAALDAARARQQAARQRQDEARRLASRPALTTDGHAVAVLANVGSPEDAEQALSEGADGVGMLRTEFVFLNRQDPPGEQEQYVAYRAVADAIGDRPLVVRTMDLGADIPAWDAEPEPNPALGNRGLRLALSAPDLLDTQLRAIARVAADRPVGLMFPMVTTVEELRQARACLERLAAPDTFEVGITIEVPAAALTADRFAPLVDFFAVGTNDLTQYTLAVDRSNAAVAGLADGLHPGVLRLLRHVTAAAERHGRSVCVVGELGSDPLGVPVLLGLGVTKLSVRPNAVAEVKQMVRRVQMSDARALSEEALEAESPKAVRELFPPSD